MDFDKRWKRLTRHERLLRSHGFQYIAGVDEAGRGPLAGPVVVAAVVVHPDTVIAGLDDSKRLSPGRRKSLYQEIMARAVAVNVSSIPVETIDSVNIYQATLMGMRLAVSGLVVPAEYVLVDGNRTIPDIPVPQRAVIGGDRRCACIAAASIVAKVVRDDMMTACDEHFPGYGFARHKGYATPDHLKAILEMGPCPLHRTSFSPIKQMLAQVKEG